MIRVHQLVGTEHVVLEGAHAVARSGFVGPRWIEVFAPDVDEKSALTLHLGLHELSIEDAEREGHPPKFEDFGEYLFIIVRTPLDASTTTTRKIAVIFTKSDIVTVLRAAMPALDEISRKVARQPKRLLASTEHLLHAVLDQTIHGFDALADQLIDRVAEIEDAALKSPQPDVLTQILETRSDVAPLSQMVRQQREVCLAILRSEHPALTKKIRPYLRDVYDHCLRVTDMFERVREGVAAARDAYHSTVNKRLSEIMRTLTVLTTMMMPLTVISSIFGMNFADVPGSASPWGFWAAVAAMCGLAAVMLAWFRRREWI